MKLNLKGSLISNIYNLKLMKDIDIDISKY